MPQPLDVGAILVWQMGVTRKLSRCFRMGFHVEEDVVDQGQLVMIGQISDDDVIMDLPEVFVVARGIVLRDCKKQE